MRKRTMGALLLTGLALFNRAEGATIPGSDASRHALGTGFDSEGERFLEGSCVEAPSRTVASRRATFHVDYARDFDSMRRSIDRLAGGGVNLGLIGVSSSVEYMARIFQSHLRESLLLEFHVQDRSLFLAPDLTIRGEETLAGLSGPEKRRRCGTDFVQQVDLGYRLYVNITLNFADEDSYERYKKTTTVSALFGLIKGSRTTVTELKNFGRDLHIEVDAHQEGGDDSFIRQRIPSDHQCAAEGLETCLTVFQDLLQYMNAGPGQADGFYEMMQRASNKSYLDAGGPSILRYITNSYEDAGVDLLLDADDEALPEAAAVAANGDQLAAVLAERMSIQQRIQSSLDFDFAIDKPRLAGLLTGVTHDIAQLRQALGNCQSVERFALCLSGTDAVLQGLSELDESWLFPVDVATE